MKLTREDVRHVATLARLSLSPEEEERYQAQLSAILEAVDRLKGLDTQAVEPTSHATLIESLLRPDVPRGPSDVEKLLSNAPARVGTSFAVPKILE
ncbi:MAG TPA: Asp-tRNA(Asn)/Glu-tRNA(Gln) amidotransferase subunit GatC [Myxococcaceae bacterium]|nr:Asp-tRNA(Asn)/Glu-tRNA(Gln) amidotransferase subunit GatC [Myxococcaceae bacterium]